MKIRKRMGKQILSILLSLVMVISALSGIVPGSVMQAEADDVIEISTADQLKLIGTDSAYPLSGSYKLTADIDLGGEDNPWRPIGEYDNPFTGLFDGGGHTIQGLYIKVNSQDRRYYYGLFGCTKSAYISGLTVKGEITGSDQVGYVGGITGEAIGGTIEHCTNMVSINTPNGEIVGGIAGEGYQAAKIAGCRNLATVTGNGLVGGVVGIYYTYGNMTFTDCYNTAAVTGTECVGGLIGVAQAANGLYMLYCYNIGTVTGNSFSSGAVIGSQAQIANAGQLDVCYYLIGTASRGIGDPESDRGARPQTEDQLRSGTPFQGMNLPEWVFSAGSYPEIKCFAEPVASVTYDSESQDYLSF